MTAPPTPEDLDALEALLAKATPGPWTADCVEHDRPVPRPGEWEHWVRFGEPGCGLFLDGVPDAEEGGCWTWNGYSQGPGGIAEADCQLIALARTMLPALLSQSRSASSLQAENERLKGEVARAKHSFGQAHGFKREADSDRDMWRDETYKATARADASETALKTAREALEKVMNLLARGCSHDMGFDRERGPLGCGLGVACVCAGIFPALSTALNSITKATDHGK